MATDVNVRGADVRIRHPFAPLGLSIITLGIYGVVWYYKINREARDLGEQVDPWISVLAVTLGAFLIVPPFVSVYNTGERIRRVQAREFETTGHVSGIVSLLLATIPIASLFWAAYLHGGFNRVSERYVTVTV
jgi:drug/metabolite transporter (DMT)-like permease